jgi:cell division protease FtsH
VAYQIDEEVRSILKSAHQKAVEIIEEHRDQHKLIAEALLEHETLNAKEITSIFETGTMPVSEEKDEFPSEKDGSFEEAKEALARKDAEKQKEEAKEGHGLPNGEVEVPTDSNEESTNE